MESFIYDLLNGAIAYEEESYLTYRKLAEKTHLSNIRGFLNSFATTRKQFEERLLSIKEHKIESADALKTPSRLLYLKATEHLVLNGDVDLSSLQNVLLFISKSEKLACEEFCKILKEMPEGQVKESMSRIEEDKESLKVKADRLYHDMIETAY